jgi:hypothetical protein
MCVPRLESSRLTPEALRELVQIRMFHRYSESFVTDGELDTLPPRVRDQIKRSAQNAVSLYGAPGGGGWGGGKQHLAVNVQTLTCTPRNVRLLVTCSQRWWR